MFVRLLGGDRMVAFKEASAQIRGFVEHDWAALQRLTTYYLRRDWDHFELGVPADELKHERQRDDLLYGLYDVLFMPLLVADGSALYPQMMRSWNLHWTATRPHFAAMVAFAKAEVATQAYGVMQRDLFSQIERYITLSEALLPGLLCNMLPPQHRVMIDTDLRLFRDDYETIRDLYIQAYESCHKALRWVVGAANADAHGTPDRFVAPESTPDLAKKKPPKNLDAFTKLVNAERRKWLAVVADWDTSWDTLFDRDLRNDIGHASAHHELATGQILREGKPPIAYLHFLARAQRMVHALLATANVLKTLRLCSYA
jgi:hypothetical protein